MGTVNVVSFMPPLCTLTLGQGQTAILCAIRDMNHQFVLAEKAGRLIPADFAGRTRVVQWCFAVLNTVERPLLEIQLIDKFGGVNDADARRAEHGQGGRALAARAGAATGRARRLARWDAIRARELAHLGRRGRV
ncbi:hypothetical protein [Polyangium sp. 15x6]|uniref:hypothetical protein n=1 Tax=Polyangium sp. 15x6 TaxID=3042687 RepID=UPI00249CE1BC|nr:hypothetical protein [Polyangium sp. 15x6]MDI3288730.1 hypothetical protein [Polyangium sp. 15x6]